jgi:hypothetical protein
MFRKQCVHTKVFERDNYQYDGLFGSSVIKLHSIYTRQILVI